MKNRLSNQKGSYTLEATIIVPAILLMLFFLVFFSMHVFQRFTLLDTAVYTARQRAVTWDNTKKDLRTGELEPYENPDGLYWRIFRDQSTDGFWNKIGLSLAGDKCLAAEELSKNRLKPGVFQVQEGEDDQVRVSYENNWFVSRTVEVELNQTVLLPAYLGDILHREISAGARAGVAEPAEYIRCFDLAAYYFNQLDIFGRLKNGLLSKLSKSDGGSDD